MYGLSSVNLLPEAFTALKLEDLWLTYHHSHSVFVFVMQV